MTTNGKDPVHLALDVFVYAPVGLALMAYQRVPALMNDILAKGAAQLGEAEARVNQARMIGQVAVTFGSRMVRRDLDHRLDEACKRVEFLANFIPGLRSDDHEDEDLLAEPLGSHPPPAAHAPGPAPSVAETSSTPVSVATAPRPAEPDRERPDAADLPIPEYDGLSASQVVSRLSGLTGEELEAVAAYEAGGRARKTVLAAIDRLRA